MIVPSNGSTNIYYSWLGLVYNPHVPMLKSAAVIRTIIVARGG